MKKALVIPLLLLLNGCGDDSKVVSQPPAAQAESTTFRVKTDDVTINKLLPIIRKKLPGLDTYADQFRDIQVEQNYWLTITFQIPQDAKIPNEYLSQRNKCFIEINKEGTAIKVPKVACKSVAFDQKITDLDSDYWFYFNPDDLTYEPYDFATLTTDKRIDVANDYLKRLDDAVQTVEQKKNWNRYDFPNYSRWFGQLAREGALYGSEMFAPYLSCRMAGSIADLWWHNQIDSIQDLTSNDPNRVYPALQRIQRNYDDYQNYVVQCKRDIKSAPPKPKKTVTLPPTPDNKPPRPGCLAVFKPDNTTEWTCPAK
ncbi:hypothetical protein [Dickeya dadantii]|uniref:hypothetical protein n=1 Tax=Dickeya dadantii TaxID=204038 RepID=UPI0021D89474|nr:hypothetical protein [Dickeya dadantii]